MTLAQGVRETSEGSGEPRLATFLPDFARDAHGNLAEQNRPVDAQKGADTSVLAARGTPADATAPAAIPAAAPAATKPAAPAGASGAQAVAPTQKYVCMACHGVLGGIPMPPQALGEADARLIAQWLADGMKK